MTTHETKTTHDGKNTASCPKRPNSARPAWVRRPARPRAEPTLRLLPGLSLSARAPSARLRQMLQHHGQTPRRLLRREEQVVRLVARRTAGPRRSGSLSPLRPSRTRPSSQRRHHCQTCRAQPSPPTSRAVSCRLGTTAPLRARSPRLHLRDFSIGPRPSLLAKSSAG